MSKVLKYIAYSLISLGAMTLIGVVIANYSLENKLENILKNKLPSSIKASYKELSINSLSSSVSINNPEIIIQNKEDSLMHTAIVMDKIKISDISYWKYLFKNEIHVDKIILENPIITHYKNRKTQSQDTVNSKPKMERPIFINHLIIENTKLSVYENTQDSTKFYTQGLTIKVKDIEITQETLNQKIPLKHTQIEAKGDSTFMKANPYENLTMESFSIKNKNATFNNLNFNTKYSKTELSKIINVERDHYSLSLKSLNIQDLEYGYKDDSLLFVKSSRISLNTPFLDIYRDKLVTNDTSIKPLYSKSLRELPFQLTIDSITIKDGALKYKERVNKESTGGHIQFKNLNADISNLSNTYTTPVKTEIKLKAEFMDKSPLSVDWSFDVQDPNDHFVFKANLGSLDAKEMNQFTEPNLNVLLEGRANKTYFTIDGNNSKSKTDLKINFSNFKVTVLQKNGNKKNEFLSAIVNIFVSKDSDQKKEYFQERMGKAERNKTKSIFNFLWISVQSALQKIML